MDDVDLIALSFEESVPAFQSSFSQRVEWIPQANAAIVLTTTERSSIMRAPLADVTFSVTREAQQHMGRTHSISRRTFTTGLGVLAAIGLPNVGVSDAQTVVGKPIPPEVEKANVAV